MTTRSTDDCATSVGEAAAWLARLHAEDRTPADEVAFRGWIAADPAHARALDRASAVWDGVGGLAGQIARAPVAPPGLSRRALLAGCGTFIVVGSGLFGWHNAYAGVYRTSLGEQRRVSLSDGSRILLDTDTELQVLLRKDRRELTLDSGRICLEIAMDPRPFEVTTGNRLITARTGRLDIRSEETGTSIAIAEGGAGVSGNGERRDLAVGQRLHIAQGGAETLDSPNLDDLLAWQSGRAVFRNETLASAAAEMNRYTARKLVVEDPRVGALRLSGIYRVGDPASFARAVAMLLPVQVEPTADAILIRPA